MKYKVKDYIGKSFGKWIIIEEAEAKHNTKCVKCRCECGTEAIIPLTILVKGRSLQCIKCRNKKHDLSYIRLYRIYKRILERCYNKNCNEYKYYGQRNIGICKEWVEDYKNFEQWAIFNGYMDNLTIDRIDVNGDYKPDNCRWVNMKIQVLNRRKFEVNTSGYTGIIFDKPRKKWKSIIGINYNCWLKSIL